MTTKEGVITNAQSAFPKCGVMGKSYPPADMLSKIQMLNFACKCGKPLVFFSMIRSGKTYKNGVEIWDSVWYCENGECDVYRKFVW